MPNAHHKVYIADPQLDTLDNSGFIKEPQKSHKMRQYVKNYSSLTKFKWKQNRAWQAGLDEMHFISFAFSSMMQVFHASPKKPLPLAENRLGASSYKRIDRGVPRTRISWCSIRFRIVPVLVPESVLMKVRSIMDSWHDIRSPAKNGRVARSAFEMWIRKGRSPSRVVSPCCGI